MKALIITGCLAASLITGSDVRAEERPPLPPGFVLNTPDTPEHTTSIDPELVTFNSADQTVTFSRKAMEIFAAELKQVRHKAYCRGLLAGVWAAEATVKDYMRIRSEEGC